jgi:uncharacterized BrkB/YihY/UPF0761 family membrane protein
VKRVRDLARLTGVSAWRAVLSFYQDDNLTYAASIAYYALVSLCPFFMLAFGLLGRATADESNRTSVLLFVLRYFPSQFDFITTQLDAFRANGLSLGVAGSIGVVWGALGVFGAITTAVTLLIALFLVSASHVVGSTWFAAVLAHFPGLDILRGIAVRYGTTLLFILVVGLVYYFVPNTKVKFREVWIGAAVTGLVWKSALEAFSWYVGDMTRFTRVNGSIAVVVVFLVWVYVQAAILLYGVEFTAAYARLLREQSPR